MENRDALPILLRRAEENLQAQELYAHLLRAEAPAFSPAEIRAFARDCGLSETAAYGELLAAGCGLQCDWVPAHRRLKERYLLPALGQLDAAKYRENPYARLIRLPERTLGEWRLTQLSYAPYQLFPCGNTRLLSDGREVQPLGFFSDSYAYPAIMQKGREWMALIPNEIETMGEDIAAAAGRVAALGLGLGYFPLMASEKAEVTAVTVIERDPAAIALFQQFILPQFPHREKIRIIQGDALAAYTDTLGAGGYDFVYVDLWHDVLDGLPLYLRCRALERFVPGARFRYWIEPTLLCFLRGLILEELRAGDGPLTARILSRAGQENPWAERLSLSALRAFAPMFPPEDVMP